MFSQRKHYKTKPAIYVLHTRRLHESVRIGADAHANPNANDSKMEMH